MLGSLVNRSRPSALGLVLLTLMGTAAASSIEFSRISACSETARLLEAARRTQQNCVRPTSVAARTIRSYLTAANLQLCFLERAPLPTLTDFECFQIGVGAHRSLTCYRPSTLSRISDYKVNFPDRYSAQVERYLLDARSCPGSNGDASRVIDTTFPPPLMPIAAHEFGFIVQYGSTRPGTATAIHGFARTSPAVARTGPEAIEYISVSDGAAPPPLERTRHGDWRIRVDSSTAFAEPVVRSARQQGIDVFPAVVDIDLRRAPLAPFLAGNTAFSADLANKAVSFLEDEGFEELSDRDLRRHAGATRDEMVRTIKDNIAFGARKFVDNYATSLRVLMKTSGTNCTRNGNGAFSAYFIASSGEEGVAVDFGSLGVFVVGLGACGSGRHEGRTYVSNLTGEIKELLLDEISKK
jgi:hypothetical protein